MYALCRFRNPTGKSRESAMYILLMFLRFCARRSIISIWYLARYTFVCVCLTLTASILFIYIFCSFDDDRFCCSLLSKRFNQVTQPSEPIVNNEPHCVAYIKFCRPYIRRIFSIYIHHTVTRVHMWIILYIVSFIWMCFIE